MSTERWHFVYSTLRPETETSLRDVSVTSSAGVCFVSRRQLHRDKGTKNIGFPMFIAGFLPSSRKPGLINLLFRFNVDQEISATITVPQVVSRMCPKATV